MQGPLGSLITGTQHAAQSSVSPDAVRIFGVTLIGATPHNLHKLLLTIGFIAVAWLVAWLLRRILNLFIGTRSGTRFQFWAKQGVSLIIAAIVTLGVMSIWFDSPARLASVIGLVGAGIAFALQRVITAVAGYFVIVRGKTLNVGDRILMGGVRGDVVGLTFMQTRIMEMGQSPREESDQKSWVRSRQFTGRIVTVTNDKVFDEPVYNYTHEFAYIWDELSVPIHYGEDYRHANEIILQAAREHALTEQTLGAEEARRLERRFGIDVDEIEPSTFWRMTENWVELTVRFLGSDHGIRTIKDRMTRDILAGLEKAKIPIAAIRQEGVALGAR